MRASGQSATAGSTATAALHLLASAGLFLLALALAAVLIGCSAGGSSGTASASTDGAVDTGTASGPEFNPPTAVPAPVSDGTAIDVSHVNEGYVTAQSTSTSRLKFQVSKDGDSYNYDLPGDGTPIVCPINMGDGAYLFRIMQNTEGSNYVELSAQQADVALTSEFAPFLMPNVYCDYDEDSACVSTARSITADAANEGEAVQAVCTYLADTIDYDFDKAKQLSGSTGYVPNPDATLASKKGICFDYASLAAAMLRSLGFPAKIVTGYVGPNGVYHAWVMVYAGGSWSSAQFSVNPNTWSRVDVTFAAAGNSEFTGDGTDYVDRYVY